MHSKQGATPALAHFAQDAYVFPNAFTSTPWTNVSAFLSKAGSKIYTSGDYHAIGRPWSPSNLLAQRLTAPPPPYYYQAFKPDRWPTYEEDLYPLGREMIDRANWPFIVEFHMDWLHLPYAELHHVRARNPLLRGLSHTQIDSLAEYFEHPEKHPDRLFLSLLLGQRRGSLYRLLDKLDPAQSKQIRAKLEQKVGFPTLVGVVNNRKLLSRWVHSPTYAQDLEIIRLVYRNRVRMLDEWLGPLLRSFDDPGLAANTIIIVLGDHGEAMGEHDYFSHAETTFDEMIRFPLLVHLPGQTGFREIRQQFYQGSVATLVGQVLSEKKPWTERRLDFFLHDAAAAEHILSHNCGGTEYSVRYRNEWKLILKPGISPPVLYHLTEDPGELHDVAEKYPQMTSELEEYWILHQRKLSTTRDGSHPCVAIE